MKYFYSIVLLLIATFANAQTNPAAQALPYSQDFSGLAASATAYPAGWQGWTITTAPASTFSTAAPTADRALTASSTAAVNSGNVHNYNGKIGFLNTGSLDLGLVLAVNTTGQSNVSVSYDAMTIRNPYDGSANTRINEMILQYRVGTTGTFTNITGTEYQNNTTTQTTAITTPQNVSPKTLTLPAACDNQAIVQLRWASRQVSGAGARPSFAVDNITAGSAGADVTPPTVTVLSPADDAVGVSAATSLTMTFSEAIQKGTGNIVIKKSSDNSTVQTIDVTTAAVTVTGNSATITIAALAPGTGYYVEVAATVFKDLANNAYAGITGGTTWNFTTGTSIFTADFNTCTGAITDGFTAFSVTGAQVWACTTFGRDASNPVNSAPNGVQINGFAGGSNVLNEDWLISPSLNLTGTAYPLLSFWSRTKFNGAPLLLKVSTDYPGTGNPNNYTWTDINGRFPQQTSDIWTLSQNISLEAFKTANTHFAFVYNSSTDDGARWTLDDVKVDNSATPPPAMLTPNTGEVNFGFVAASTSLVKTMNFTGNDLTGGVTLNATGNFLISKTNGSFTSSLTYTQAEANNILQTVYVQFSPTAAGQFYTGNLTISTPSVTDTIITLRGNSIDAATTLEVVNWNIEWFGSTSLGPTNDNQQETNIRTIMQNIGADVFALEEVVSEPRLANIVSQMPGYSYVLCDYGSHTNPFEGGAGPLSEAQKEALVYKTALFPGGVTTQALVTNGVNTAADLSNPAYNYFSSGRYPFMVTGTTTLNGVTKQIRFVIVHAKANTSPTATAYARRKASADTLRYTLNTLYPNDNIIMLGDFNDDLDSTITDGISPKLSSYKSFTDDNTNFFSPTLALSLAGKKSTVSYNDVIDHVMLSNEMQCSYMPGTANILTDVSGLVTNYGSTTTDHYPVFTRYLFAASNAATITYGTNPYCTGAGTANVTMTGTTGGTYTATPAGLSINATTGAVTLGTSTPATYTVTYTLAANSCSPLFTTTASITVTAGASATISYAGTPYCSNAAPATVTRTGTAGGTYTAAPTGLTIDATTGTVTPSTSTAGTYTVTYTVAAAGGCAAFTTTASVVITAAASATISYAGTPFCSNAAAVNVTRTGTAGGTFTASPAGLSINGTTGTVTPASSTAGTYTVTYTVAAAGGCAAFTTTASVTITAAASATISYAGTPYCSNAAAATVTRTGTAGGTYTASPAGLTIDAATGTITPATSTAGTYTVTYTIAVSGGCAAFTTTASVVITAAPSATITYGAAAFCTSGGTAAVTRTGTAGGTYTSSPAGLSINSTTGLITLGTSTAGTYTVTYTVAASGGCAVFTTTASVTVSAGANATINYAGSPYCQTTATASVTATGTTGGTYSSTTGLTIDVVTGQINVTTSTPGTYTVTYTIAANGGCAAFTTTAPVTINSVSVAPTSATASSTSICGTSGSVTLTAAGGTLGSGASYKWYTGSCGGMLLGTGATLNNVLVNATTTFYVRAEGPCNNTTCASVTVTVAPAPSIVLTVTPGTAVTPAAPVTITATVSPAGNYVYQWYKNNAIVTGGTTGTLQVAANEAGTYKVIVSAVGGCAVTSSNVVITETPTTRLFILPNPNHGIFTVNYSNTFLPAASMLNVYDSKGAQVYSKTFAAGTASVNTSINISQHAKGIYIVVLKDANGKKLAQEEIRLL
jgi:methionine-rich copper-binding protein CopC/endonuclease/exonuclease/phosphatase family metal-dependent hydrolase